MVTEAGSLGVCSSTKGTKKLDHDWMNVNKAMTKSPGMLRGAVMCRRILNVPAPSVAAASSSSMGTLSMKFLAIQTAKGSDVAARKRTVQSKELTKFNDTKMS